MIKFLLLLKILLITIGDGYMYNPIGSNNRCERRTNDITNTNKLYDSQNNVAGCYKIKYFEGYELDIRWILQHNCEDPNLLGINVCDCKPQNINGNTCEETMPILNDNDITNKERYGIHENFGYYQQFLKSYKNPGFLIFDHKLRE